MLFATNKNNPNNQQKTADCLLAEYHQYQTIVDKLEAEKQETESLNNPFASEEIAEAARSALNNATTFYNDLDNPLNQSIIASEAAVEALPYQNIIAIFTEKLRHNIGSILQQKGNRSEILAIVNRLADQIVDQNGTKLISSSVRRAIAIASFNDEHEFMSAVRNVFDNISTMETLLQQRKAWVNHFCGIDPNTGALVNTGFRKPSNTYPLNQVGMTMVLGEQIELPLAPAFIDYLMDLKAKKKKFANANQSIATFLEAMHNYDAICLSAKVAKNTDESDEEDENSLDSKINIDTGTFIFPINNEDNRQDNIVAFERAVDMMLSLPEVVRKGIKTLNKAVAFQDSKDLMDNVRLVLDAHALVCSAMVAGKQVSQEESRRVLEAFADKVELGIEVEDIMAEIEEKKENGSLILDNKVYTALNLSVGVSEFLNSSITRFGDEKHFEILTDYNKITEERMAERAVAQFIMTEHIPDEIKTAVAGSVHIDPQGETKTRVVWNTAYFPVNLFGQQQMLDASGAIPNTRKNTGFYALDAHCNATRVFELINTYVNNPQQNNFRTATDNATELASNKAKVNKIKLEVESAFTKANELKKKDENTVNLGLRPRSMSFS